MTPIDYIRVDVAILSRRDLTDKAKLLLGLAQSFNSKGLMMKNLDLASLLNVHEKSISRIVKDLKRRGLVEIENARSRYRKIFYCNTGVTVKDDSTVTSTHPTVTPALPHCNTDVTHNIKNSKELKSITPESFVECWNSNNPLPTIRAFSKGRRDKLAARAKEDAFRQNWREIIRKLSGSPFHTGKNDRGWRADCDWILKNDTNYLKILELPNPMDGVTKEIDETELNKILGDSKNE